MPQGKAQFDDLMAAREHAKNTKWHAIEHLDTMLEQFEKNISARGAKVIWAETAEEALNEIGKICKAKNCKTLVKSKSMVTEEIHLNKYLKNMALKVLKQIWANIFNSWMKNRHIIL